MGPNPNDAAGIGPYPPSNDIGGVMFQDSRITFGDINTGSSNVIIIGECTLDDLMGRYAAIWPGDRGWDAYGTDDWWISDVMWYMDNESSVLNGPAPQAFSSQHVSGVNFLYGDGSVRYLLNSTDPTTLMAAASRK